MAQSFGRELAKYEASSRLRSWKVSIVKTDSVIALANETKDFALNIKDYFSYLRTDYIGKTLLYAPLVSSTQTVLKDEMPEAPPGTIFVADKQMSGKGRGSNTWVSPDGCLMFSLKLQLANPKLLAFIQYLVCLVLVKAIKTMGPCTENLDVRIKWPNDIYTSQGVKLGGILCQSSYVPGSLFDIIVGVGLNVSNTTPTTCLNNLIRTAHPGAPEISIAQVLAAFLTQLEASMEVFIKAGFEPFLSQYLAEWMHTNQTVELRAEDHSKPGKKVILRTINLESGYLLAVDAVDAAIMYELHPDGNSLDWMKGLLVHKVMPSNTA